MARPRIGLALGSGSARGWAHIGVICGLVDSGLEPDVVCGSSIGALIGGAYVSGRLDSLETLAVTATVRDLVRLIDVTLSGGGLIEGERLKRVLAMGQGDVSIETLPKPFGAVATDLAGGREIWLQEGSLLEAVRASISVPGIITPARHGELWLVDGGLVNPGPVSLCRALGAQAVIAVNLNADLVGRRTGPGPLSGRRSARRRRARAELLERIAPRLPLGLKDPAAALAAQILGAATAAPGLFDVLAGSIHIMQDRITSSRMAGDPPEVLLQPRLAQINALEFDRAQEAIDEGRDCVHRMLPVLEAVIGSDADAPESVEAENPAQQPPDAA